jgi:glucose/mannose transport system substrate-binding protein
MPQPVLDVIKVKGHFYAVPVDIHMSTWIWYSKAAFKKAGIARSRPRRTNCSPRSIS